MAESQVYTPLPRYAIRLALLKPGYWKSPLELDLRVSDKSQDYTALSYTWGSCAPNKPVILNGFTRYIRNNLDFALRTLRSPVNSLLIWVDALCINQDDIREKNAQVEAMHDIFAKAERVYAYVGTSLDPWRDYSQQLKTLEGIDSFEFPVDDDAAWATIQSGFAELEMNDVTQLLPAQKCRCIFGLIRALSSRRLVQRLSSIELFSNTQLEKRDRKLQELFEWLRMFVVAPWWARMWIIQEVGAARKLQLTYCKITVPFTMLEYAARQLETRPLSIPGLLDDHVKVLDRFVSQVQTIRSLRQLQNVDSLGNLRNANYFQRSLGSPLLWLLRTFRHRHSKEPRDKIFALSNVLTNLNTEYYDLGIDYNTPVPELFCNVAISIMQQTGLFWVTSRDLISKQRDKLPSWVPDWSYGFYSTETDIPWTVRLCHNASNIKLIVSPQSAPIQELTPAELHRQLARTGWDGLRKLKGKKYTTTVPFRHGPTLETCGNITATAVELDRTGCETRRIWYESYDSEAENITKAENCLKIPSQFCSIIQYVSEPVDADFSNLSKIIDGLKAARRQMFPRDWDSDFFQDRLHLIGRVLCFGTVLNRRLEARRLDDYDQYDLDIFVMLKCFGGLADLKPEWRTFYRNKFTSQVMRRCNRCSPTVDQPCQQCVDGVSRIAIPSAAQAKNDPRIIELTDTASKTAPGNRIIFTGDAKLALGPETAKAGDRITILTGGLCPYILRRKPESNYLQLGHPTFSLIGDCYLDKTPKWEPEKLETIALV